MTVWGTITGTLSSQTDLQAALDAKVAGPASAVDHEIARFDGTTGKLIEGGGITIADGQSGALSGTNSGDVTLAGSPNYLTIAGQIITRALISLSTHVTGLLPFANFVNATAASKLVGRGSASGAGAFEEITLGTNLSMSGTTLNAADTDTGITQLTGVVLAGPGSGSQATTFAGGVTGSGAVVLAVSPTLTGSPLAPTQTPKDNSTKIATTAYVENAILGQNFKEACKYGSTTALPAVVYANGSSGVGATLTAVAFGALSFDGNTPSIGDRVLIKNQASTFQNGIYTVTVVGAVATLFILTRATDFDQSSDIGTGDSTFITSGTTLAATTWAYTGIDAPTMGSTAITFVQTAGQGSLAAPRGSLFRLTLTTGVPLTSADVTGAGTIYLTPYKGNTAWTYDSSVWTEHAFAEISLALTLTATKNYDVFLYNNAGTMTLELSAAWTNDTTRADALALQDGVPVKSSDHSRLWLGSIAASGTNTTEDSRLIRFVSNFYNDEPRNLGVIDTTDSWTYSTFTYRQARGSTANQVAAMSCRAGLEIFLKGVSTAQGSADGFNAGIAIGEDSTTTPVTGSVYGFASSAANIPSLKDCFMSKGTLLGRHIYVWLEIATTAATTTWFGDSGGAGIQSGLAGSVRG